VIHVQYQNRRNKSTTSELTSALLSMQSNALWCYAQILRVQSRLSPPPFTPLALPTHTAHVPLGWWSGCIGMFVKHCENPGVVLRRKGCPLRAAQPSGQNSAKKSGGWMLATMVGVLRRGLAQKLRLHA
jgi:hypothetical protein